MFIYTDGLTSPLARKSTMCVKKKSKQLFFTVSSPQQLSRSSRLYSQGRPGFLGIQYTGVFKSGIRYIAA